MEDSTVMGKTNLLNEMLKARFVMAPLAGITDIPFRLVLRSFGCRFAFTEMVDVNGIVYGNKKTGELLRRVPGDSPLGVQIVGGDADKVARVGRMLQEEGYGLIDLNCGCPARKVVGSGKGAALLKDPVYLGQVLRKLRKAVSVPLTVKMRSGWEKHNHIEIARVINEEGIDAICIHARTREDGFKGRVAYDVIAEVKRSSSIPVFASGGLFTAEDVLRVVETTGADGAFLARGALGKPWIFKQIDDILAGRKPSVIDFDTLKKIVLKHFEISRDFYGTERTFKRMHKQVGWYFRSYKKLHEILSSYRENRNFNDFREWLCRLSVSDDGRRLFLS